MGTAIVLATLIGLASTLAWRAERRPEPRTWLDALADTIAGDTLDPPTDSDQ